jgi:hypothetical protein
MMCIQTGAVSGFPEGQENLEACSDRVACSHPTGTLNPCSFWEPFFFYGTNPQSSMRWLPMRPERFNDHLSWYIVLEGVQNPFSGIIPRPHFPIQCRFILPRNPRHSRFFLSLLMLCFLSDFVVSFGNRRLPQFSNGWVASSNNSNRCIIGIVFLRPNLSCPPQSGCFAAITTASGSALSSGTAFSVKDRIFDGVMASFLDEPFPSHPCPITALRHPSYPKNLHHLVPKVVDHLHRDPPGLRPRKRP